MDINSIAEEHGHAQLGVFKLSKDHRLLAYTIDLTGEEMFTLFVKDLVSNVVLPDHTIHGVVSVEWSEDGESLYYTSVDAARRPYRVSLHELNSRKEDAVILEDECPKNFVDVTRTKDWEYVLVNVNSKTSSEVFYVKPSESPTTLRKIEARADGVQYFVEHHRGYFYILTNHSRQNPAAAGASDYRLVRCKVETLTSESWQEIVAADSECWIEDMDVFEKHLILYRRQKGLPKVQVIDLEHPADGFKDRIWNVNLPPNTAVLTPGANADFCSTTLRLSISSPVMPEATYDVDLGTGELTLLQQPHIPLDVESYSMEHHTATADDNIEVPLTIISPRDLQRCGQNPALIIGYGAYGAMLDLSFSSDRLSLLDRGWIIAFAHVRGGGTLGKSWHFNGKLLKKQNSFSDIITCIEYLIKNQYVSRSKIAAWGESAGGLLIAAAVNLQPQLFNAVILKVPFLDILNTMLDPSLSLTEHEFDEWGDPRDKQVFHYIRQYSPYENIRPGISYPAMLVTASFLDTRVGYWEAAKWVAAIRHLCGKYSNKPILLRTNMSGGHYGDGGRYSHLKETAYDYAFLINVMKADHKHVSYTNPEQKKTKLK